MRLQISVPFDPGQGEAAFFDAFPPRPAVFALFPTPAGSPESPPFISRTSDLRRRLSRLLAQEGTPSRRLNLQEFARRIDYQCVGSAFEAQWLLYLLNRVHYPLHYRHRLRLKPPALLKVNLRNRFPRCYPTRRLSQDGSVYCGPFPSRAAAERFAAEFLDLFRLRRCYEELNPDPAHPGCIYSQMRKCLAPCFAGCTDEDYQEEVSRVTDFLETGGQSLLRTLEEERQHASDSLDFEHASKTHRKLEAVQQSLRLRPDLAWNIHRLHAVVVQRGAEPNSVVFFRLQGGRLHGPARLCLDENVPSPVPLDQRLSQVLGSLAADARGARAKDEAGTGLRHGRPAHPPESSEPPLWEHLSLLARWYYSSFREGELVMLPATEEIPHARLVRICRKMVAATGSTRPLRAALSSSPLPPKPRV